MCFLHIIYRSDISRFDNAGRAPKFEKKWSDRARRRLWVRSMRRGSGGRTTSAASPTLPAGASVLLSEAAPKVQSGLRNIHLVRLKIEEIMLNELDASASAQLSQLVGSVRANIDHICKLLDVAEQSGVTPKEAIVVNKLRNDIAKEEVKIYFCCICSTRRLIITTALMASLTGCDIEGHEPRWPAHKSKANQGRIHTFAEEFHFCRTDPGLVLLCLLGSRLRRCEQAGQPSRSNSRIEHHRFTGRDRWFQAPQQDCKLYLGGSARNG